MSDADALLSVPEMTRAIAPTPDPARLRAMIAQHLDFTWRSLLFELEGMTTSEIAKTIDVPEGTVGSRLRRARQAFKAALKRYRARTSRSGVA